MRGGRRVTVWILGDQLSPRISSLRAVKAEACTILMVESVARARLLPFHKQKIAFVWSAMRHFAAELREQGFEVDYFEECDDYETALKEHLRDREPNRVRLMETAEHGGSAGLVRMLRRLGAAVEETPNNAFLSDHDAFVRMAGDGKSLVMERFYRLMRRKTGLLMRDGRPEGGAWNYDRENRDTPPPGHRFPKIPRFRPDATTRQVLQAVERRFADHFGELRDFALPVTRRDAQRFARDFFDQRLDLFGPYEDAIVAGERTLYHSLLSPLINVGLLDPLTLCREAETRYRAGSARLSSVEGFIRQIIGWREFVYQVYRWQMPGYSRSNQLGAELPLPDFYWSADTDMDCVADAVRHVRDAGMNHHIQRLMVTGNFALIAGIDPQAVNDWYRLAYVDAFDWVVTPNVLGMALYADGGLLATKPYAASANYIHRMSDCCSKCSYDRKEVTGERACPFNSLYWDFIDRNRERWKDNPRMTLPLRAFDRRAGDWQRAIREKATQIRATLRSGHRL